MTISLLQVLCVVLGALAAYWGVRWFFRIDTAIENRRREAAHLANKLSEMGFKELPEVFLCYAVGDYSGLANHISIVVQRLRANDKDIFEDLDYKYEILASRMKEMAFLNKGLKITLVDDREDPQKKEEYRYEGGIVDFVNYLCEKKDSLHKKIIYVLRFWGI